MFDRFLCCIVASSVVVGVCCGFLDLGGVGAVCLCLGATYLSD